MAGVRTVILDQHRSRHAGPSGRLRLSRELAAGRFDAAILLTNSFDSALVTALARIPRRGGYACDLRGFLLTDPVACPSRRAGGGIKSIATYPLFSDWGSRLKWILSRG